MIDKIEGYEVREIRETIKTCFGCFYYDHRIMRSGREPEYRDACKHPQAVIDYYGRFAVEAKSIEDREIREHTTPHWCPAGERKK